MPTKALKTLAYLRASTDKQDINNQKLEILEYARKHDLRVSEFIEITISTRKTTKQRRIDEMLAKISNYGLRRTNRGNVPHKNRDIPRAV